MDRLGACSATKFLTKEDLKRPVNRDNKLHLFKTLSLLLLCAVLVIAIIFLTVYHFRALNDKQQELEELKTAYYNLTSNFSDHLESLATFQSQYEILYKSHAELLSESRKLKQCISPVIKMSQAEKTCSLCPEGWVSFHSKCYFFSTDLLDWQSSQEKCMSMCGHLVIVESAEEQNFLENKMKDFNDGGYWIGLTDQKNENTFVWVDNRPLDSNNRFWDQKQPNGKHDENCVQIWRTNQQKSWHDYPCGTVAKRVCETTAFLLHN